MDAGKFFAKLTRKAAVTIPHKPFFVRADKPVVSFTFDDCPASAIRTGGRILAAHHVGGTYYVCGSLTDQLEEGRPCHTIADLKALPQDGHELGSHLFSHVRCRFLSATVLRREIVRNQAFVNEHLGDTPMVNFAYPFGSVGPESIRMMARHYVTARGIAAGLNAGLTDFAHLRANALYAGEMSDERIRQLVEMAVASRGWLIFYTHDVDESPSPWGTTPQQLDFAVTTALAAGCEVLPIRNAIGAVGSPGRKDKPAAA